MKLGGFDTATGERRLLNHRLASVTKYRLSKYCHKPYPSIRTLRRWALYIEKIAIENYKSYLHPQEIQFTTGFNVVVGANNAGKTALVEALTLRFEDKPHASVETVPNPEGKAPGVSQVDITLTISQQELKQVLSEHFSRFSVNVKADDKVEELKKRVDTAFSLPEIHIHALYKSQGCVTSRVTEMEPEYQDTGGRGYSFLLTSINPFSVNSNNWTSISDRDPSIGKNLSKFFSPRIYHFRAERYNVGQHSIGNDPILKPDASNLAQVLNLLQTSNPERFKKLVNFINIIFPDIQQFTIPPVGNAEMVKILLWHFDASTERQDLAIPLQESGTGIGQVLAILYVAINSDFPRPVIIDEPQSFLHPSAIRKLFNILRIYYPQHQYIVTTHSPVVISAANPNKLILLKKVNVVTQVENIPVSEKNGLSLLLEELGARLSDVFGADNVLWVEGATEENCFPLIVQKILQKPLLGTAILGVLSVGELEGKHSEKVWKIYQRLSKGKALIPPAIGFIFDREGRSQKDRAQLERESNGQVHFLSRRMYENYLLNPEAIAAVISQLENFASQPIEAQAIETWIEEHRWDRAYYSSADKNPESWMVNVHAGKLLDALFKALSEGCYSYDNDKAYYGLQLTSWLIENRPDDLSEIKELLNTVLDTTQSE